MRVRPFLPALAIAAALVALPAAAPAQIVLPGTQPGDIVNWWFWESQEYCVFCHSMYSAQDYEPYDTWAGSMMANSARDPLFWAAVDIANQDVPGAGEFCLRCHAPRGWLGGRSSVPDGSALAGRPDLVGGDFEGVDCAFCHRLYEGPEGTPFHQNGQYWVDDGTPSIRPPFRGPYDDAGAPHPFQYSPYHGSSELCAICHNLRNPLVNLRDETGADTGLPFPEQVTYDEWAQSRYPSDGTRCQDCHMPAVTGYVCTDLFPLRDYVPKHELIGANAWMSSVLKGLYGGSLVRDENFDRSINLALANLQHDAAELRLQAPFRADRGAVVVARVRVTNLAGHKLPTGYPEGRRMWLSILVEDAMGGVVYESGRYDTTTATLEPDPDLTVYAAVHGMHEQGPGSHLVLNDRIFRDTRIPPAGFVPDAVTAPVGADFETLPDGSLANWDDADYEVAIPVDAVGPLTVTASLWYQTASRGYVEFLRDENVSGPDPLDPDPEAPSRGAKIHALWDASGRSAPILMQVRTRRIRLDREAPADGVAPEPRFPRIVSIGPNPFREHAEVVFEVPEGARVRLAVFDVTGRRVRILEEGTPAAGSRTARWDGRDDTGAQTASGSYFVRLDAGGFAPRVERLLLLR